MQSPHYGQNLQLPVEGFKRFDMGSDAANIAKYGQSSPPDYDLSLLDFPIAILAGTLDHLVVPKDIEWTHE